MKKESCMAITGPQESLIINIGELYLRSMENQEQTLGIPRNPAAGRLGGQQKQRFSW